MSRLTPLPWEKIVCVFEQLGYRRAGQKGSHIKLEKPGVARPGEGSQSKTNVPWSLCLEG